MILDVCRFKLLPSALFVLSLFAHGCGESNDEPDHDSDTVATSKPESAAQPNEEIGAGVFNEYCSTCHGGEGAGVGAIYPPLAASDFLSDKEKVVDAVVNGLQGEISVNGKTFNAVMPPLPPAYNDEAAASVIRYVVGRFSDGSWSVTAEEVAAVRH
jgi:mono/diheme cytochrome c family protein